MKKTILTIFSFILSLHFVFAGGIVTNTNQSAAWVRSMVRDASVDVDAVFFNPAGLTHLEDGFYIQVNSQTVTQTRTITSDLASLNDGVYEGSTFVPFLPTGFLAYKKGKLAVSAGFTVIGGGGSAEFDRGLPEFEAPISVLPGALAGLADIGSTVGVDLGVSGYSTDIEFEGSSAYYGFQAGVSYKINDVLSVGIGGRYVMANNTYTGSIKNISVMNAGQSVRADEFLNNKAVPTLNGLSNNISGIMTIPTAVQPIIDAGAGGLSLTAILDAGLISQEQFDQIVAGVGALGQNAADLTIEQISQVVTGATPLLQAQKAELDATSGALSAQAGQLGDKVVDVSQSGSGFTPIVSVDLSFMEGDLGVALKYEHKTTMKVTTEVIKDDTGIYTDGEEVHSDMPGMVSVGLRYAPMDKLRLQGGFHYYLDMDASYGKKDDAGNFVKNGEEATIGGVTTSYMNSNSYEAAFGLEFDVIKMLTLSAGYLYTASDPNDIYQSGLSYSLKTGTFGIGGQVHLGDNFDIDLGFSNTTYTAAERDFGSYTEKYEKTAYVIAAGLTYKF